MIVPRTLVIGLVGLATLMPGKHDRPLFGAEKPPQSASVSSDKLPPGAVMRLGNKRFGWCMKVAYSPDGRFLAAYFKGGAIRLWDVRTGKMLRSFGSRDLCTCEMMFSPDGKWFATGNPGSIVIWDANNGKEVREIRRDSPCGIRSMAFSENSKTLLAAQDGYNCEWDVVSGKERPRYGIKRPEIWAIALSPDGKVVAGACGDGIVRLWDRRVGKLVRALRVAGTEREFQHRFRYHLSFPPDGSVLAAVCGNGGTIDVGHLGRFQAEIIPYPKQAGDFNNGRIGSFAYSPDGRSIIATGYAESTIRLIEVFSGRERARFKTHSSEIAFAPDGKTLATGERDGVLIWDLSGSRKAGKEPRESLSEKELDRLWAELENLDAARAYRAIGTLVAGKRDAVPFVRRRVRSIPPVPADKLKRLIDDLEADNFRTREKASRELALLGVRAKADLVAVSVQGTPEQRRRAEELLAKLRTFFLPPGRLRVLRAIEVLERAGGPDARAALRVLAAGVRGMVETEQARASLLRLQKQND